jgi:hypothetical protein
MFAAPAASGVCWAGALRATARAEDASSAGRFGYAHGRIADGAQCTGMPLVIVDAENVRRSLWPNLSAEELVSRARAWAAREGHDLLIVFDGPVPEEAPDLVSSPYADDEIVRLAKEAEGPLWVVTSDRGLRARLTGHADRVVGGGTFARSL